MKAFVTGSTGLLGSNLVNALVAAGYQVKALARSREKAEQLFSHPQVEIVDGLTGFVRLIGTLNSLFGISVEKGAQTTLYLATSPEVEGVSGKYFSKSKETPSSKLSYDVAVRKRLWQVSEELIRPYAQSAANEVRPR